MDRAMFRFTIRDLLWLTTLIAVLACWMVDRSKLIWQQEQTGATIERLREALDAADPGWRERNDRTEVPDPMSLKRFSTGGYVLGVAVFFLVAFAILLVWRGRLHSTILTRTRRWPE
jgi:hypothetical protein